MAGRFPDDLVMSIVYGLFNDADRDGLTQAQYMALFCGCRLIGTGWKSAAHRAYPDGVRLLAEAATKDVLAVTSHTGALMLVELGKRLFAEAKKLTIGPFGNVSGGGSGMAEYSASWVERVPWMADHCLALTELHLSMNNKPISLAKLQLSMFVALRSLYIHDIREWSSLAHVDFRGSATLEKVHLLIQAPPGRNFQSSAQLPQKLEFSAALTILSISGVVLSLADVAALGIGSISSLTTLNLNYMALSTKRLAQIQWWKCPALRELDLSHNKLGDDGLQQLCQHKTGGLERIETLRLSDNSITNISFLQTAIDSNLKELNLTFNKISDLSRLKFSKMSLHTLLLRQNEITSAAALDLASNPTLVRLDLTSNKLGTPLHLGDNDTLEFLALSMNPLTNVELGLGSNRSLRVLDLEGVRITVTMAEQLSSQLSSNSTLRELNLSLCSMTSNETRRLNFKSNVGLEQLWLGKNQLSDDGALLLAERICNHPRLRLVDFSGNDGMSAAGRAELGRVLGERLRWEAVV